MRVLFYEQWLERLVVDGYQDMTVPCPECLSKHRKALTGCPMCEGEGFVAQSKVDYTAQVKRELELEEQHYKRLGLKCCGRCGHWGKLIKTRWGIGEICRNCFEQVAEELRQESREATYDRHYLWGQGL